MVDTGFPATCGRVPSQLTAVSNADLGHFGDLTNFTKFTPRGWWEKRAEPTQPRGDIGHFILTTVTVTVPTLGCVLA